METAKEYLLKLERLDELIKQRRTQVEELKLMAETYGARSYGEIVKSSKKGDTQENKILKYVALEQDIEEDMVMYIMLKQKIIREIESIEETKYIKLLYKRYVELKRFKVIAKEMHYDQNYIRILHLEALDAFQCKVLNASHNTI